MNRESHVKIVKRFYGASSPNSIIQESRVTELEDLLDLERDSRLRCERLNAELSLQLEALCERMEDSSVSGMQHLDAIKKRDCDISKLRKELEISNLQLETMEHGLRRKFNSSITEMSSEIETLQKSKGKTEKDRNGLIVELESTLDQLDRVRKANILADSKLESIEAQTVCLRNMNEDLQQQNTDLNTMKGKLSSENYTLQALLQENDVTISGLRRGKSILEVQLDELKKIFDEESRNRMTLQTQLSILQSDYESLGTRYEDESDTAGKLGNQVSRLSNDMASARSKYDKELTQKTEECDDMKRRLTSRINELADEVAKEASKASALENVKQRLMMEMKDLNNYVDLIVGENADLTLRLKEMDGIAVEFQKRLDNLSMELNNLRSANSELCTDNLYLTGQVRDLGDRNTNLERENHNLTGQLKDAKDALGNASKLIADLESMKSQLEVDRENLMLELKDLGHTIEDMEQRYQITHSALIQLKSDMEQRLREKDAELESLQRSTQRTIDELTMTIKDIEVNYNTELNRLKNKYEISLSEVSIQLQNANNHNLRLTKENKDFMENIQALGRDLEDERCIHEATNQRLLNSERKRLQLKNEMDDIRNKLEASERARKNAENECLEIAARVSELTLHINVLLNDKRRLESDLVVYQGDLEVAMSTKQAAEDRANKLNNDVNRLMEELRQEQDNYTKSETLRKSVEIEIRDITIKLHETETLTTREGKRVADMLQARIRELEANLDAEQRRGKETQNHFRKIERQYKELQQQAEDDKRMVGELQDMLNKTQLKLKAYKRQLEEMEGFGNLAMDKYRKAQQQIDDAESRAELAERHMTTRRSGSVTPGSSYRRISIVRESSTLNTIRGNRAMSSR